LVAICPGRGTAFPFCVRNVVSAIEQTNIFADLQKVVLGYLQRENP